MTNWKRSDGPAFGRRFTAGLCLAALLCALPLAKIIYGQDTGAEPVETQVAPADPAALPPFLYVPFMDLSQTLGDLNASILVPLSEYLRLTQSQAGPAPAPPGAVMTSAAYSAVVDGDLARVHATLKINVLGAPWVESPLSFGDAAIGQMKSSDGKVILSGRPDGSSTLLFGEQGERTVDLDLVVKVRTRPEGREFSMTTPPVAITTIDVQVPDADQTVEIEPRQSAVPMDAGAGTHVRADVGSTSTITVRWYPRASQKPELELLASAYNEQSVTIDEGLVHRDAWLRYDVLRGRISQARLSVPKASRILDVAGDARIRGWKAATEDNRQVLTVDFLSPIDQQLHLEVHTEEPLSAGSLNAAGLTADGEALGVHALDVVRESGQVAVHTAPGLALTITEQRGLTRVDAAQTAERLRADGASAFQYYSPAFVLRAEVKPIEPRLTVSHRAELVFQDDELRLSAGLDYSIERAGVFELRFKLPDDLTIDDVQCPAMKDFRVDDASRTLIVTLAQKTSGATSVTVRAHRTLPAEENTNEQPLPLIEPLNVDRELGTVLVFAKESIDVVTNAAAVVSAQPFPAPPGAQAGDARLTSSWSFTRRPVVIPVRTVRKPVRLSVDIGTSIRVLPQLTEVETRLGFLTEYSGLDTFRFMVPEGVSERLRIEVADAGLPIRQKTSAPAENGWVTWTIVMQRETLGRLALNVAYDLRDAATDETGEAGAVIVRLIRPLGGRSATDAEIPLSRISGQIAVSKDDSLALTAHATGGDVEPIDVRELTLLPAGGTAAFRYFRQPDDAAVEVSIEKARNEVQPVVATIVSRALVEVVTGDKGDAAATFRCRFRLRTSERQRLMLHLPVNLELLGAFVNGRDTRLERADLPSGQKIGEAWDAFWLNVAREGADDQEFTIALQFLWKLSPPMGGSSFGRGALELPLPVIGPRDAPAAVQELRVAIWTPKQFVLVGDPPGFQLLNVPPAWSRLLGRRPQSDESALESWLSSQGTDAALSLPREGRVAFVYSNVGGAIRLRLDWWRRIWANWIASGALAVIALVLLRTSWENKLSMLLFGGFAFVLYSLQGGNGPAELASAMRYGLLFLAGLWIIHGLFQIRSSPRLKTPAAPSVPAPTSETSPPAPSGGP